MMKITVIHGVMHKGSTYHCVSQLIQELECAVQAHSTQPNTIDEFFLPRDMSSFCCGCYSCFLNGEHTCPHYEQMSPIQASIEQADLIVLDSPNYVMDVTGQMKTLLDHLAYRWMSHRPHPSMFQKVGIAVSTTAGSGAKRTAKTMRQSLTFWGVKRVYSFSKAVGALKFADVNEKNKKVITKKMKRLSKRILHDVENGQKQKPRFITRFLFHMFKMMQKGSSWNPYDKNHWESNGWLAKKKPY